MRVVRGAAVAGGDEPGWHAPGDRPGAKQADVGDDVLEVPRLEPGEQVELPWWLDLEAAQRVGGADQLEGFLVVEVDVVGAVEVELPSSRPADLGDGVRHRGLHAHAEDVELQQAESFELDVFLVGLDHRVAARRRLHGHPVQQGGAGEDDAAGVHRVPAREAVEALGQLPQRPELVRPGGQVPQLGQLGQRGADVAGPDVREGLRDLGNLLRRHPEGEPGIPQGVTGTVGLRHPRHRHPVPAEPGDDLVVDLQAAGGLHVQVDVGQARAPLGQEPLEEEPVFQRVGRCDEQGVVDHRSGAGAARRDADTHRADVRDDLRHRQEVPLVAEAADHAELILQLDRRAFVVVQAAGVHPGLAPLPQQPHRVPRLPPGADGLRLGEVRAAHPEIRLRVDAAAVGGRLGLGEQRGSPLRPGTGGLGDPPRDVGHGLGALEPAFPAVRGPAVDRTQETCGVQDVGDPVLGGVGVADRVRHDDGHVVLVAELERAGGQAQGSGAGALPAQPHRLQPQPRPGDEPPRLQQPPGHVRAPGGQRPHRLGHRAEQHHQVLARDVLLQHRPPHHRHPVHRRGVRGRHDPAQPSPTRPVPREQRDPVLRLNHVGASPHRSTAAGRGTGRCVRGDGDLDAEDGPDAGGRGRVREAHRPGDGVPVGQREGADPPLGGPAYEIGGQGPAVPGRVPGRDMKVHSAHEAPPIPNRTLPAIRPDITRVFERRFECDSRSACHRWRGRWCGRWPDSGWLPVPIW